MATYTEQVFISEFNVLPSKSIGVRKTTAVAKDGEVISQTYWRCVLAPHDPQTQAVLGDEPYYYNLALDAWKDVPVPAPEPVIEGPVIEAEPETPVVETEGEN